MADRAALPPGAGRASPGEGGSASAIPGTSGVRGVAPWIAVPPLRGSGYAGGLRDRLAFALTSNFGRVPSLPAAGERWRARLPLWRREGGLMGSVIKKRRKRMAKKKHRKLLKKTRIQRRNKK
jgi:Mitochondrial domain of unknown function (DUF1713)